MLIPKKENPMTIYAQLTNPETIAAGPAMSLAPVHNQNVCSTIHPSTAAINGAVADRSMAFATEVFWIA